MIAKMICWLKGHNLQLIRVVDDGTLYFRCARCGYGLEDAIQALRRASTDECTDCGICSAK